jgi:hypothetical protein
MSMYDAQILIRVPHELVERADEFAKRLAVPGLRVTRTDALRVLLNEALTAAERSERGLREIGREAAAL